MNTFKKTSLYALLIAIVLHVAGFLFMNVTTLNPGPVLIEEEPLLELDFTEEEESEEIEEEELSEKDILEELKNDPLMKDLMRDINNAKRHVNKFDPKPLNPKKAESKGNNKTNTKENSEKNDSENGQLNENSDDTKNTGEDKPNEKTDKTEFSGSVTVDCYIKGRSCSTKRPTYKCKGGGKVHIDIKVDKIGRVKSAKVNKIKSTTTNECILKNALNYAKNTTKVASDLDGNHSSTGYIIYNFISQ